MRERRNWLWELRLGDILFIGVEVNDLGDIDFDWIEKGGFE